MDKFRKQDVVAAAAVIGFFLVLGWVGDYDYCEQVILHMSQEEYDSVRSFLLEKNGSEPSERDIAHWWAENHHAATR